MDQMGGLIELVLVFGLVLGLAVMELLSIRRYRKSQAAKTVETRDADLEKERQK